MFLLLQDFLMLSRTGRLGLCSGAGEPYFVSSYRAVMELEAGKDLIENILISGPNLAISLHGKIN